MKPLLTTLVLSVLILPLFTYAQYKPAVGPDGTISEGLVPCEGALCSTCDVVVLANTGIKWLLTLSFLFFGVLAVRAGVNLILAQGKPGALQDARQSFTNAFIGLIIILVAWILVDTLLRQILEGGTGEVNNYGPWSSVKCVEQVTPLKAVEGYFEGDETFNPTAVVAGGNSVTAVAQNQMTSLRSIGVVVANWNGTTGPGRTDLVHPTVAQAVLQMQNAGKSANGGRPSFQVTAAYTQNVGHSTNSQHYKGTAVDLQPINGGTYDQIIKLCKQVGFSYVNDERAENHIHCDMR